MQEWPQLLDPHLAKFIPPLVAAFLEYLQLPAVAASPSSEGHSTNLPLPRAISLILYTFCKIRGAKIIVRFFNNEPRYLEPMLSAFEQWDTDLANAESHISPMSPTKWTDRYIMLLWLAHLLLVPFDLSSISSDAMTAVEEIVIPGFVYPQELPGITKRILPVAIKYLAAPGREHDAAKTALVRLALRRDMRQLGLLQSLMAWALSNFDDTLPGAEETVYKYTGVLSFIAGFLQSSDRETAGPYLLSIYGTVQNLEDSPSGKLRAIGSSALVRKTIIKISRAIVLLTLQPNTHGDGVTEHLASSILEDVIDRLLTALADNDTPVRFAASKTLSIITLKLDSDMAAEVVEAVVGCLGEDVLWEKDVLAAKDLSRHAENEGSDAWKRSLTAVNALRWHGLTLTLAHLLLRRSPPPSQLPNILNSLILALEFEQRSATGSSIGTNVRDAACFGVWALSRRYHTDELRTVDTTSLRARGFHGSDLSIFQLIAAKLVEAACLDPSGNIRRGSSAALQELIGRHPDMIIQGIPVVQVVDYHAVALRSRAITEVASAASKLDPIYWYGLFDGLLGWRGVGAADTESRRVAAIGIGGLLTVELHRCGAEAVPRMVARVFIELSKLRPRQVEEKHGLLLALAHILDSARTFVEEGGELLNMAAQLESIWTLFSAAAPIESKDLLSSVLRPEITAEAACRIITSIAKISRCSENESMDMKSTTLMGIPPNLFLSKCVDIVWSSLTRSESRVVSAASEATKELFRILGNVHRAYLLGQCLSSLSGGVQKAGGREFGQIAALGEIFKFYTLETRTGEEEEAQATLIMDALIACAGPGSLVEARVAAIHSLANGVLSIGSMIIFLVVLN
jgi:tubulin-specific chaperone D